MKILLLSQFFSSTRGGGEYLFYCLAKQLADNNHQVWIITNKIKDESYLSHKNIKIIFVPPVLAYQGGLPPSIKNNLQFLLNGVKIGLKIIRKNQIDIIHSNNFTPAIVGGLLASLTRKKHITSIWDIFTLCGCDYWKRWVQQSGVSGVNQLIGPIFEKLILKIKCDAYHTISKASKEDLLKFGAKKIIHVIPPTIEDVLPQKINPKNKQFIYLGRLVFYKNVEILIKAIKIVQSTETDIKLIIVGGGPQLSNLKQLVKELDIQDNIEMKGHVSNLEKPRLIAESNALLFPSTCEGFGLVILEAFQQKKPVLVSDIPPMSDIIEDGHTGYLINSQKEEEWAKKIIHLIHHQSDAIKMGQNGYSVLKESYNQKLFYSNMIDLYNSILKK